MKLNNAIIILIIIICNSFAQDTTTVEFLARKNTGEIIVAITPNDRNAIWAEMIIRGTHDNRLGKIKFDASLYKKYFRRMLVDSKGKETELEPIGSFRTHSNALSKRVYDVEKVSVKNNLAQALKDIKKAGIKIPVFWPWGNKEKLLFYTFQTNELSPVEALAVIKTQRVILDSLKSNITAMTQDRRRIKKSWLAPLR